MNMTNDRKKKRVAGALVPTGEDGSCTNVLALGYHNSRLSEKSDK